MIVNSVSLYKPYTSKTNKTINALPQAHTSPAFTSSERPPIPRQSAFGGLRALTLGLFMSATANCSSGTTPSAIDASPATPPIATIDSAATLTGLDTAANCGNTNNNKIAIAILNELKDSGLVAPNEENLPCQRTYELPDRTTLTFNDTLIPVSTDSKNVTYTGTMSCKNENGTVCDTNVRSAANIYTIGNDGIITNELQIDGKTLSKTPMTTQNGIFDMIKGGGENVGDKSESIGYRRAASGGAELCSSQKCMPVKLELDGRPIAALAKKFTEALAQLGKALLNGARRGLTNT